MASEKGNLYALLTTVLHWQYEMWPGNVAKNRRSSRTLTGALQICSSR
eukprot:gene22853-30026_t